MNDEERWLRRMADGDKQAMEILIERYYPDILRYCRWHTPNEAAAEDATQETFFKAIRFADHYVHRGKWRAYLYQIARHTCIDMARKASNRECASDATILDPPMNKDAFAECESTLSLQQMIRHLPQAQQEIVWLRFAHDLRLREIAAILDLPLRTVQSRLRTALKQLRHDFEKGD